MRIKQLTIGLFILICVVSAIRIGLNLTWDMRRVYFFRRLIRHIQAIIGAFDSAIDICCGVGYLSEALLKEKPSIGKLTSVDINDRKRFKDEKNQFIQADATSLPFHDKTYDLSFIAFGLHHIENPLVALNEARRITKGYVIILEDIWSNPIQRLSYRLHIERANRRYHTSAALPVWTEKEWRGLFKKAGFTIIKSKPIIQIGYYVDRRMYILKPGT